MDFSKSYLDLPLLHELMNIYHELTNTSIAFYIKSNEMPIYSDDNWPLFCQKASSIMGHITCNLDDNRLKTEGLFQCKAGLWCYSYPLTINNDFIGTFVLGHRLLKGKEKESIEVLEKTLKENKIDKEECHTLLNLLSREKSNYQEISIEFDVRLFQRLSFIISYVTLEHQRSSKEYDRILAFKNEADSLAHEFLLPIQSIVAEAENLMVEASTTQNKDIVNMSEDILQEIIKLSYIAENIRGSYMGGDKVSIEYHTVNILDIIQETAQLYRNEARKKNVLISIKLTNSFKQEGEKYIQGSKRHIERIFFNLIQNAVKYSFSGNADNPRYISIMIDIYKNMFICKISNYGSGILPDEIDLIFEKGYRGKLSRDRCRIGSGFGLSIVKEIIAAHKGKIEVESKNAGSGSSAKIDPYITTFTVSLPYTQTKK